MRFIVFVLATLLAPHMALAQSCPQRLASATKLVLVEAEKMSSTTATLRRFERSAPSAPWQAVGEAESALIGYGGVGWARGFRAFARAHELLKVEGDNRLPAGFFPIGHSFGFSASPRPDYLQITTGTVCVDDPKSSAYNTITSRAKIGVRVHGENMWSIPQYRRGLLVDYPTDTRVRAGSCIFIHLRLPGSAGTHGCVALPEAQLAVLQDFAASGAVLGVLPRQALDRFKGCLPR
jgi:L,D-peptidoglycan transpeptidase YkuD (ErfK/YbiS/YcfS/YnhG family)